MSAEFIDGLVPPPGAIRNNLPHATGWQCDQLSGNCWTNSNCCTTFCGPIGSYRTCGC